MQRSSTKGAASIKSHVRSQFPKFFDQNGRHVLLEAKKLSGGLTNHTYLVRTKSNEYIARLPGNGSEKMINREHESDNTQTAFAAGVTPEVVYDEKKGKKITRFLKEGTEMNIAALRRPENVLQVVEVLKKLHAAKPFVNTVNIFARNREWLEILQEQRIEMPDKFLEARVAIDMIENELANYLLPSAPCHLDTTPGNFILSEGRMSVIDFEYAGNNDPVWDLAYLAMEADFTAPQCDFLLRAYFGDDVNDEIKRRFQLYQPVVEYHIGLWSLVQLAHQNHMGEVSEMETMARKHINRCVELLNTGILKEDASRKLPDIGLHALREEKEEDRRCLPCRRFRR